MKIGLKLLFFFFNILIAFSCSNEEASNNTDEFIKAADMSMLPLIESEGIIYFNKNNIAEDALLTLKNAGCNTIRIRLWHTPTVNQSGFNEVKAFAQRVKNLGMKVWLSVHYSDTWADPGNQEKPAIWNGLTFSQLKVQVENYTVSIVNEIQPDIFQIGNEINNGFVFPDGNLATNETQFISLLASASNVIRTNRPETKIMLHYAGIEGASWFFSKTTIIDYDYIGLSYYPIWHGTNLSALEETMSSLAQTYNKKVLIAETSYPFTLNWNDWTNNVIGLPNQIHPSYSASPEGQKAFLEQIKNTVKSIPNGQGFCYWGAEWIAFRGTTATNGSSWENQAFWDFNRKALPAMSIYN
ncbi:glycoside hydrolase family 53 protein [Flavobacterium sp.]|uniref:glycoside hydrolase family 53 protein n=2 Tax=Flavobacterium sp. TaxID=239 RepID=UPI004048E830